MDDLVQLTEYSLFFPLPHGSWFYHFDNSVIWRLFSAVLTTCVCTSIEKTKMQIHQ